MPVKIKKAIDVIEGDVLINQSLVTTLVESTMDTGGQIYVFCDNGKVYPFNYEQEVRVWEDE